MDEAFPAVVPSSPEAGEPQLERLGIRLVQGPVSRRGDSISERIHESVTSCSFSRLLNPMRRPSGVLVTIRPSRCRVKAEQVRIRALFEFA